MASVKKLGQPATWAEAFRQGAIFLAFAVPFVWLIGMIVGAWSVKGDLGNAADWVQAISSIAAIATVVFIAKIDRDAVRKRDRQRDIVVLKVVHNTAQEAFSALQYLNEGLRHYYRPITDDSPGDIRACIELVDSSIRSLSSIELTQLPEPEVVSALIGLKVLTEYCRKSAVAGRDPTNDIRNANFSPLEFHLKSASDLVQSIGSKMT